MILCICKLVCIERRYTVLEAKLYFAVHEFLKIAFVFPTYWEPCTFVVFIWLKWNTIIGCVFCQRIAMGITHFDRHCTPNADEVHADWRYNLQIDLPS